MDFIIRELEEADLAEGRGFFQTLSNLSDVSDLDTAKRREVWQQAKAQGAHFFVAVVDNQIVSTVKLLIEPKFYFGGKSAGHIEDVATRSGYEGRGLAKALLQASLDKAKSAGCYKVILDCKKDLVPFYGKVGFQESDVCMRIDFKK